MRSLRKTADRTMATGRSGTGRHHAPPGAAPHRAGFTDHRGGKRKTPQQERTGSTGILLIVVFLHVVLVVVLLVVLTCLLACESWLVGFSFGLPNQLPFRLGRAFSSKGCARHHFCIAFQSIARRCLCATVAADRVS